MAFFNLTLLDKLLPQVSSILIVKFIYSEKATKFCEIFNLLLSYVVPVKSKVKILQKFEAFSEYMIFSVKTVVEFEKLRTCCRFLTNLFPKIMYCFFIFAAMTFSNI